MNKLNQYFKNMIWFACIKEQFMIDNSTKPQTYEIKF